MKFRDRTTEELTAERYPLRITLGGGFPAGDELAPTLFVVQIRVDDVVAVDARLLRKLGERHLRFLRRAAGLAVIARLARGHEVVPRVAAASMPRHDVVEGEVALAAAAAGLAGVGVS